MLNPARIRILAVGRIRRRWVEEGLNLYRRRLPGLEIREVKDATPEREAAALLALLEPHERLVALSEEGLLLGSAALAQRLADQDGARLAFVIGGADGLSADLRQRASWLLSLSPLTFPHELARLLLLEQLYRARTILAGGPYHRC
ncbi:MAG: 23S rRNA (pseudouridine(1915)-N(3))-methyltransferase RlmH [Synechococcaceae cyanobacterium]|nr:23S rRNA (pseudouridine(1915)-N(3))-methyltransferase RlmH [Synechococcaceae cyanobacterium]